MDCRNPHKPAANLAEIADKTKQKTTTQSNSRFGHLAQAIIPKWDTSTKKMDEQWAYISGDIILQDSLGKKPIHLTKLTIKQL